jgi:hypothetical protein
MKKAIELRENRAAMAMCETQPRYDVFLHGARVCQLYFNIHGYRGTLPTPSGGRLDIGEKSIHAYRGQVAILNREFMEVAKS